MIETVVYTRRRDHRVATVRRACVAGRSAPDADQLAALAAEAEHNTKPVTMLNVLRFKDPASYSRYAAGVQRVLNRIGAKVVWSGTVDGVVIGDGSARDGLGGHHAAALVRYPSRKVFLEMVLEDEEYASVARFRETGLRSQWLLACTTTTLAKL